jgi:hypothetical protein
VRTPAAVLKSRRDQRRAMDKAILRALRAVWSKYLTEGDLSPEVRHELAGLELARRRIR